MLVLSWSMMFSNLTKSSCLMLILNFSFVFYILGQFWRDSLKLSDYFGSVTLSTVCLITSLKITFSVFDFMIWNYNFYFAKLTRYVILAMFYFFFSRLCISYLLAYFTKSSSSYFYFSCLLSLTIFLLYPSSYYLHYYNDDYNYFCFFTSFVNMFLDDLIADNLLYFYSI